jgi:glucose dehydrogenase
MERSQVKRLANGILLAGIAFSVGAVVLLQNGGHILWLIPGLTMTGAGIILWNHWD